MIYRAARGVYWDNKLHCLYFKGNTSRKNALKIITEAMKSEYGITLLFKNLTFNHFDYMKTYNL